MNQPIVPTTRRETGCGLLSDIPCAFIEHLRAAGLAASQIFELRRGAQHFLTWLGLCNLTVESIDDAVLCAFRRHDCHCPDMEGERRKMLASEGRRFTTGALKLVQFLEDQGCIPHLGELDANLRYLDGFLTRCKEEGYGPGSLHKYRGSCQHILTWLHRSRISITEVDAETLERFLHHDCVCPGTRRGPCLRESGARYEYPFRCFLQHLDETGTVAVQAMTTEPETDLAMEPFKAWLRRHRGIGETSIHQHSRQAAMLVADLGPDPHSYDATGVREVLLRHYVGVSRSFAGKLAGSMRMYLRYLVTTDSCSPSLVNAVSTATSWRLASLPRYISSDEIEHVIACCDVTSPAGLRDRAILLLLARLALRAGDIVTLRLEDIDWRGALVRVCGKSKRQECLPLPQDAGDAVLDYIENERPRVPEDRIFLRAKAPHRPLASRCSISSIVVYALKRAGLEDVRPQGAHLFRHSTATAMVRSGQSLETISALLRHKSMDTTAIYAKTDTSMLLDIAQPWIGDSSCA